MMLSKTYVSRRLSWRAYWLRRLTVLIGTERLERIASLSSLYSLETIGPNSPGLASNPTSLKIMRLHVIHLPRRNTTAGVARDLTSWHLAPINAAEAKKATHRQLTAICYSFLTTADTSCCTAEPSTACAHMDPILYRGTRLA